MADSNCLRQYLASFILLMFLGGISLSAQEELHTAQILDYDRSKFGIFIDPARSFFNSDEFQNLLQAPDDTLEKSLTEIFSFEYKISIGKHVELNVSEYFTLESWLRHPRRAVLFLNGSAFNGDHWTIPSPGYNAVSMFAKRGIFAFTIDFLGTGDSTIPENGRDVTFDANVESLKKTVDFIRLFRKVPKVDLVTEGYGSAMGTQLAANKDKIRSLVMSSALYLDLANGPITDPAFVELLETDEDGYIFIPPESYLQFLNGTPDDVTEYIQTTQAGEYPVDGFLEATRLPFYDPGVARVPGLIIYGTEDGVVGPDDPYDLAAAYGEDGASLLILEGAGHAPRIESPESAKRYWDAVFDFIQP